MAAVAAVLLLRTGVDAPAEPARGAPTPTAVSPPPPPPLPSPPYDRLPGRTAIPEATRSGWALGGPLPPVGPAGEQAALRAAALVLGRYCFEPARYTVDVTAPDARWRRVDVAALLIERGGAGPALPLRLTWTGRAYAWSGPAALAAGC